jgi:hypothetical protein
MDGIGKMMSSLGHLAIDTNFPWHDNPVSLALELHHTYQQVALRHSWAGLVADTNGSADKSL